ncbi:MAG: SDR family NAD(P)-dependent oxidoreductase [bacterium]|nr:SDR family NAD(P)-dependent oxidoreductase [bacterium]
MTPDLSGQTAVVTGGTRGIGRAIAETLIAAGAQVVILGRSAEALRQTAAQIGAHAVPCDVTDPESVRAAFAGLERVDVLVNNAGDARSAAFHKTDLDLWERMIAVNLTGTYLCMRAAIVGMTARRSGRIVNIASTAGLKGYAYVSAYCAAKHGVIGLTRALAQEVAAKGITVNAVCPGYVDTEMTAETIENIVRLTGRTPDEARAELVSHNPQGRLITAAEVAETVLWLLSPAAAAVHGQALVLAGGEL